MAAVGRRSGERGKGMRLKACVVFLAALAVLSADLTAFDGLRKGFILGGGVGGSYLTYKEPWPVGDFRKLDKFSLETNFRIGHAPSNSLEIYWFTTVSWSALPYGSSMITVGGIGLTKYLNREGKGFFLFSGLGSSANSAGSWFGETKSEIGLGLIGGVGYDIAKHWSVQGDVVYASFGSGERTSLAVRVTLNFLAF